MTSKKPESLITGYAKHLFDESTDTVYIEDFKNSIPIRRSHASAVIAFWEDVRDYEPEPWEPRPGELFREDGLLDVYRRVRDLYGSPHQLERAMGGHTIDTDTCFAAFAMGTGSIMWFRLGGAYVPVEVETSDTP